MMRSIAAASMESSFGVRTSCLRSDELSGFEMRNRLVGEPDLVEYAAPEQLHDDFEQPFVGCKGIGDDAGFSQIVRSDGIGFADHLDIHHLQSALDQHGLNPPTD